MANNKRPRHGALLGVVAGLALQAGPAMAAEQGIEMTLAAHHFTPDHVTVPAGTRFKLRVTSHDSTPDEFESQALRVEKIVMPGQTITVTAGPLAPGKYDVFDDYHPETAQAVVEAQ